MFKSIGFRKKKLVLWSGSIMLAFIFLMLKVGLTSAATYTVPSSINADCSADVASSLNSWLASVPDGSTINFPSNACYGLKSGLVLNGRNNLAINGNGGTVKLLTNLQNSGSKLTVWNINGGGNIKFENMSVEGDNPSTASDGTTSICQPSGNLEWQYGIAFDGTHTGTLSNVNVSRTCGDFVEAQPYINTSGNYVWTQPAMNITISGGNFSISGRQGFGLTDVDSATLNAVTVSHVGQAAIDVEPDTIQEYGRNITIQNSSFSYIGASVLSNFGYSASPNVGNISLLNNTQTHPLNCYPEVWIGTKSGPNNSRSGYTISGNHFSPFTVLVEIDSHVGSSTIGYSSVNNIAITNNVDSGAAGNGGCSTSAGIVADGVNGVTVTGNDFGPTVTYLAKAQNVSNYTACGNKDSKTNGFDQPTVCSNGSGSGGSSNAGSTSGSGSKNSTTSSNGSKSSAAQTGSSKLGSSTTITPSISNPSEVASVDYMWNGKTLASITKPPFDYNLNTSVLPTGCHDIDVVVHYKNGRHTQTVKNVCLGGVQHHPWVKWLLSGILGLLVTSIGAWRLGLMSRFFSRYRLFVMRHGKPVAAEMPAVVYSGNMTKSHENQKSNSEIDKK